MTILYPEQGEEFTFTVSKALVVAPDTGWVNTYEFKAIDALSYSDLESLGAALADFESQIHMDNTRIVEVKASTWQADSHPYNPEGFAVWESGRLGQRQSPNQDALLPLSVCLHLRRETRTGRPGKLFYRGVLNETDVQSVSGQWSMEAAGQMAWASTVADALADSNLGDAVGAESNSPLRMAMISYIGVGDDVQKYVTFVTNLSVRGLAMVKTKKSWYNRG